MSLIISDSKVFVNCDHSVNRTENVGCSVLGDFKLLIPSHQWCQHDRGVIFIDIKMQI